MERGENANHLSDKGLKSRIHNELSKFNKIPSNTILKCAKNLDRHFTIGEI